MDTNIGVSAQTSLTNTSTADTNSHNYYIARWVSRKLNQTSIAANTWDYKFAASEQNANANFPRNGAGALHINCYVWRTSNGTKTGTILNGNSAADFEEAGTTQTLIEGTFSGSAVSSINTNDDVIIFEAWAIVTQAMGTAYTQTYFYDGTTESSTSNNAAFIGTPETISFVTSTDFPRNLEDTVTVSEDLQRVVGFPRGLNDTVSSSEDLARSVANTRTLPETTSSSEDLARSVTNVRTLEDTTGSSDDLQRIVGFPRELIESAISVVDDIVRAITNTRTNEETTPVSDDLQRQLGAVRTINESSVTSNDSVSIIQGLTRAITEAATSVGDQLDRLYSAVRELPESVSSNDSVDTDIFNTRVLDDTTGVSDQLDRTYGANRELPESVSSDDSVSIAQTVTRLLIESAIVVNDQLDRLYGALRTIGEDTDVNDSVDAFVTPGGGENFDRDVSDTVGVSDQLDRNLGSIRNLSDNTGVTDDVSRSVIITRILNEAAISIDGQLTRAVNVIRELSDNIGITEQLDRTVGIVKELLENIGVFDVVSRATENIRNLIENVGVFDSIITIFSGQKNVATTDISILITDWLEEIWTDDPVSTAEHYLIPPKSQITFGNRFDMSAGTHSDVHIHVRNVSQNPEFLDTADTIEENSDIVSIYVEVRYIPDSPPDFSGETAGAPSDMMWQIRSYLTELIRSNPEQLESQGIEVISIMQELPDANTPADVHAQNVIENMYTIVIVAKCFYTLKIDRVE